jgi:crotonobetainyl-CoA:carnitine CoA-transferase CaiB-like acyl-CoA transferase
MSGDNTPAAAAANKGGGSENQQSMLPLDGIKVLDLSRVLAGPWCTQTLADLGAEVWKVEAPGRGDDTRSWTPPDRDGESTYFMCANRSKRSIAVNLKTPQGQALVQRLAARADVLVENYRLGALKKFGLDYESLSQTNPGLVYCSISGYGRTGPRAAEPGYDFAIQAESGLMSITGEPDGEPMKLGVAITDLVTGMNAGQSILAALLVRQRTGRGQLIDLALLDGAVNVLANIGMGYLGAGSVPRRLGNGHPTIVPYQIVSTADGRFALAVGNDGQFAALCDVLERPDLAADPRYVKNRDRVLNRDTLVPELQRVLSTKTTEYWLERIRAAGIPAGKVRTVPEALNAPEVAARGLIADTPDARHGSLPLMRSPLALRGTPPRDPVAPPRVGEHTDQILRDVLAVSEDELAQWREAGAIG